ncbi:MAG: hypothetical protein JW712_08115 [Dehalococcoidales bacterium]|nr:hypothetical protein [Dehalococcoidales bacterium]
MKRSLYVKCISVLVMISVFFGITGCGGKDDEPLTPLKGAERLEAYSTWNFSFFEGIEEFPDYYDREGGFIEATTIDTFDSGGKPYMVMGIHPLSGDATRLFIFDMEEPLLPRMVSSIAHPVKGKENWIVTDLAISNDIIYCGLFGDRGLWKVDISDPAGPADLGVMSVETNKNIIVYGDCLYSTGQMYNGIIVCDISNPAEAGEIRKLETSSRDAVLDAGEDVLLLGIRNILTVYDISSPENPVKTAELELDLSGGLSDETKWSGHKMDWSHWANIKDILIDGDYAYIAFGAGHVRVVDISDPANPLEIKKINLPGFAVSLNKKDDLLYVSNSYYEDSYIELAVLDLTDLENPVLVDTIRTGIDFVLGGITFSYCWMRPQFSSSCILVPGRNIIKYFRMVVLPDVLKSQGPYIPFAPKVETDKEYYTTGEKVKLECTLESVHSEPVTVEPFPPVTEIEHRKHRNTDDPVRIFPEGTDEKTLKPEKTLSYMLTWDQKDENSRQVDYGVYTFRMEGFGFGKLIILPPEGVLEKTVIVNRKCTVNGITVTFEKAEFIMEESWYYFSCDRDAIYPSSRENAEAQYRLDNGPLKNAGTAGYYFNYEKIDLPWGQVDPVSKDAEELTFIISRIGDVEGPWEFNIPLGD